MTQLMHAFCEEIWNPAKRARDCSAPPEQRRSIQRLMRTEPAKVETALDDAVRSFWSAQCACQIICVYLYIREVYGFFIESKCPTFNLKFWNAIDRFHTRDCGCNSKSCRWMRNVNAWTSERPLCPLSAVLPELCVERVRKFQSCPWYSDNAGSRAGFLEADEQRFLRSLGV
jgi:hypothetical protein